jgi:glycosyltransferase involved in cell wall biosynthesis
MRIVHIITSLNNGGAEAVLFRLIDFDKNNEHIVISMMDKGKYGALLNEIGVDTHCLNMCQGRVSITGLLKLFKLLHLLSPNIVQTWMYHANLVGGIIARVAGIKNVVWSIHHTYLSYKNSKLSTIIVSKLSSKLSGFIPKKIVCCAQKSLEVHSLAGYAVNKLFVINNGYDLSLFNRDNSTSAQIRRELNIGSNVPLMGLVGRFDPLKDHQNLLLGLAAVRNQILNFKCCLVGLGMNIKNDVLIKWIEQNNLSDNIILLDQRSDVPSIMNALDMHILSSSSEAFPNVLCEAMACGTPCVTTDVGDAKLIIGGTGWVVPSKDPKALSEAILEGLNEFQNDKTSWYSRQERCRNYIENNFDIKTMVKKYQVLWKDI